MYYSILVLPTRILCILLSLASITASSSTVPGYFTRVLSTVVLARSSMAIATVATTYCTVDLARSTYRSTGTNIGGY